MKIRLASSIALAGALALGLSGCGLITHQATTDAYAPSDGIELTIDGVALRNVLLVADESGENFNVVFSAVNQTGAPVDLSINFVGEGSQQASAEVELPEGTSVFGDPEGELPPVVVSLENVKAGSTVDAYFQVGSAAEEQRRVPVLDGTLTEYAPFALPSGASVEGSSAADEADTAKDADTADEADSETN